MFAGGEMYGRTWQRLHNETRMNAPEYLIKRFQYRQSQWSDEIESNRQKFNLVGPRAYTEECLD